jgi:hypothetical protein
MDYCKWCGQLIALARVELGYRSCMACGEREARAYKHTIVPMHKSNYVPVTDRAMLRQLTRPGRTLEG